jgi:lipopolysaccharide/colanic/teichoic acid biosynthesis glycosyltransferase
VALQDERSIGRADCGTAVCEVLPAFGMGRATKRLSDIAAVAIGLILFSPLLLIASIAIKLETRGPIFIGETLCGYKNRSIRVTRFRLTRVCAENDRIHPHPTRVGRILNQTGVGELPGLFSVLRGDMSIIGPSPCPHPQSIFEKGQTRVPVR